MPTTPTRDAPYPPLIGVTPDVPRDLQALALSLDDAPRFLVYAREADLPAITSNTVTLAKNRRFAYAKDTGVLFFDVGVKWVPLNAPRVEAFAVSLLASEIRTAATDWTDLIPTSGSDPFRAHAPLKLTGRPLVVKLDGNFQRQAGAHLELAATVNGAVVSGTGRRFFPGATEYDSEAGHYEVLIPNPGTLGTTDVGVRFRSNAAGLFVWAGRDFGSTYFHAYEL